MSLLILITQRSSQNNAVDSPSKPKVKNAALRTLLFFFFFAALPLQAESLNMNVSGETKERVPLEKLPAAPELPDPSILPYSLDGGKAARDAEMTPLSISNAAKMTDRSRMQPAGFPTIPSSPYVMHPVSPLAVTPASWTFLVVDDADKIWHEKSGHGMPTASIHWNGQRGDEFVLDPNAAYVSLVKVTYPDGGVATQPGQAARFPAFARQDKDNVAIVFGERIYAERGAAFAADAFIYLNDLTRRLSMMPPPLPNEWNERRTWSITLLEPAGDDALSSMRLALWKKYLEDELGIRIPQSKLFLRASPDGRARVEVLMKGVRPPEIDAMMHAPIARLRRGNEKVSEWVKVKPQKKLLVVELRHDCLFRSGTAYLRDEAVPAIARAMDETRRELNVPGRKVLLRSYTEKVRDAKKDLVEEDPALAALRSKVLFSLFARAGLINAAPGGN